MTAQTKTPEAVGVDRYDATTGRTRFLVITVVVLAAALIGLGIWLIYDATQASETAASDEIQTLLEDYTAAFNDYDADAFLGLVTAGFVQRRSYASFAAAEMVDEINGLEAFDWSVAMVGEPIVTGTGPSYASVVNDFEYSFRGSEGADGISTFTIIDVDGTLKISRHHVVGDN